MIIFIKDNVFLQASLEESLPIYYVTIYKVFHIY